MFVLPTPFSIVSPSLNPASKFKVAIANPVGPMGHYIKTLGHLLQAPRL